MQPAVFYDFFKEYILVIIFNYEIKCEHNHFNSGVNGTLLIFIGINLLTNSLFLLAFFWRIFPILNLLI